MADDLKFRLALEYDAGGLAAFQADVSGALSSARGAGTGLSSLADSITSVSAAAAAGADDLAGSITRAAAAGDDLAPLAGSLDSTASGIASVATAADGAEGSLASVGAAAGAAGAGVSKLGADVELNQKRFAAAQQQFMRAQTELASARTAVIGAEGDQLEALVADLDAKEKAFSSAKASLDQAQAALDGGSTKASGGLLSFSETSVKAAAAITAVTAAIGVATAQAAEYQQAITLISTLSSDTAARFDEYKAGILGVSQALGQDAVAAARAAYDALSSGVSADSAISFLEGASKAATAGVTSVDVAGKALTVTLNSFNLQASETTAVSDAMFAAANVGVTTFDELASSFGGVAGIAASAGASYQETLGALAQITTKGKSTSEAVTQLKATFTALAKPNALVAEALQKQGFASAEAAIKAKGLQSVLETVRQVSVDSGQPLINLVGSVEAVSAILDTTGDNAEASRQKMDALAASAGSTQAAFDLISETPSQRMAVFQSSVQAAVITLGDAFLPVLSAILDALTPLVQGLTSVIQGGLVPLGEAVAGLPEPIRLLIGLLAALAIGGTGIITAYATAGPIMSLFGGAAATAGGGATVAAGGVTALQGAAALASATITAFAAPLLVIVGVFATLAFASDAASSALEEQYSKLDQATAGWDEYAQASARAREEAGLLASIGFGVNDLLSEMGDEFTILGDEVSAAWTSISSGASSAVASLSSFFGAAEDTTGELEVSAAAAIDAGEAYLRMGTNISESVLESDAFASAQARLNEAVRNGKLDQDQYKDALLATANAISQSQGAGAVLDRQQQSVQTSVRASLGAIAETSGVLSSATLASAELSAKQEELATAVAQGKTDADAARAAFGDYVDQLARGDTEAQAAISANADLARGYAQLVSDLENGNVSFADASARIQELGLAASASDEAMAAMQSTIAAVASSPDLAAFGVTLDTATLADAEKLEKAIVETYQNGNEERMKLFSEILQAEHEYYSDRAGLVSDNEGRLAKAGEEGAKQVAEARAKGDAESIAKAEEAAAKRVETVRIENEERLKALDDGYAAEQAKRQEAIAQASLDQVNAMLRLGQISEDQAKLIFGSLADAFPGAELFDSAAMAALEYNATFGRAIGGSVEDAVLLGDKIKEIPASLDEAEAKAAEYEAGAVASYQATRAEVEGLSAAHAAHSSAAASSADGAMQAADTEQAAAGLRINALQGYDAELAGSVNTREGLYNQDAASSAAATDAVIGDNARSGASLVETAGVVDVQYGRMTTARSTAAGESASATDQMVDDTARLQGATTRDLTDAEIRVRRFGGAFPDAAASVRVGAAGIVTETTKANQALGGLGTDLPSRLAPASNAVLSLGKNVVSLGEDVAGVADKRIDAEEGAARAAKGAADDTTSGMSDIARSSEEAETAIKALREALEALPDRLQIPVQMTGADTVKATIASLVKDLKAIQTAATIRIYGTYIPRNAAMKPDESLRLQHDVEDALAAAEPGLNIYGRYEGEGAASWTGNGLAIAGAVAAVTDQSNPASIVIAARVDMSDEFRRLLYDTDAEAVFLAQTLAALAELQRVIDEASAASARARSVIPAALGQIAAAIDGFFTTDPAKGGLAAILAQFDALAAATQNPAFAEFGEGFFLGAGILDVSSLDDFRRALADLADEPERQEDLWGAFIDALENRWKVYYERESNNLERQKRAIQAQIDAAVALQKAAGIEDPNTDALDAQLDAVDQQLRSLKDQNEDINLTLREQTFNVQAQFDLYGRLSDAAKDRAKVEADAQKARQQALKAAEDTVRGQQKESEAAEKDAHEQAMDLLAAEIKRRERAHKREMADLDERRERTEADIKAQIAAEEQAHKARLAAITAEVDAADARNTAEEEALERAKLLVETAEKGNALTAEQIAFLRDQGIDPDKIIRTNTELGRASTEIEALTKKVEALRGLFDKLPDDVGRVRLAADKLRQEFGREGARGEIASITDDERKRLEELLSSAGLSKSDRRIIEVFLAGGVVQAQRLRDILGPAISADEKRIEENQKLVDLAEQQVDLAGQLLEKREAALKVAQDEAETARDALKQKIDDENQAFEDFKDRQNARLGAIDAEKTALKERYDAEREAISDAREAEEERHAERMRQIQAEYALELLRLGNTEAEVQRILEEQAERAARIAAEADRRYREALAAAGVTPTTGGVGAVTPLPFTPGPSPGGTVPGTPGGGLTVPQPTPPILLPGPGGPAPTPPAPPIEPPLPPPFPFGADTGDALVAIDEVFGGIGDAAGRLAGESGAAGGRLADALVGPSLDMMEDLHARAIDLTGIMAPLTGGRGEVAFADSVSVDRRIVFNGPVTIDRDVAEELGLLDAARLGAP